MPLGTIVQDKCYAEFVFQTMEVLADIEMVDTIGSKVIQVREKQIANAIIHPDVRNKVTLLFNRMSAMPASRKMSIMPGITQGEEEITAENAEVFFCYFFKIFLEHKEQGFQRIMESRVDSSVWVIILWF